MSREAGFNSEGRCMLKTRWNDDLRLYDKTRAEMDVMVYDRRREDGCNEIG